MVLEPRAQTAAEAALIQSLIKEIVEPEVMGPMEKIGWTHGQPPPPEQPVDNPSAPGTPAPVAPVAPVVVGQPDPAAVIAPGVAESPKKDTPPVTSDALAFIEELKDPKTGLYGGKYKTREEFLKGVGHVVQMAKGAYSKADAAEQEAARLRTEIAQLRASPAAPAAVPPLAPGLAPQTSLTGRSAKLDSVLSKLKDEGGILDEENMQALVEGISELASTMATQAAEKTLATHEDVRAEEDKKWREVDAHMQEVAPDSLNYSNEIGLYVQSTPLVAAAVGALIQAKNLNGAAELAWQLFRGAHQGMSPAEVKIATDKTTIELEAADQVRREAVEKARKDAGVVSSAAAGVHETPGAVGPTQEEIDQAAAEMRAGDGRRWRALTIGRTLTGPLFDNRD
jgi:hypothetical protein